MDINYIENKIEPLRDKLLNHRLYSRISKIEDLQTFTENHIYAVWDFMSLLKALQINLTCTKTPWGPNKNSQTAYLINEIVLAEETDVNQEGYRKSHYELYLEAMETIGAKTDKIKNFVSNVIECSDYKLAVSKSDIPIAAIDFMNFTFDVIDTKKTHIIASVFTFGREDLIPDMFINIVKSLNDKPGSKTNDLLYYLERHIEMDGDEHGPMALKMISGLCGDDKEKWNDAIEFSNQALKQRIKLWDYISSQI